MGKTFGVTHGCSCPMYTCRHVFTCLHTSAQEAVGFVGHKMDLSVIENHWGIVKMYYSDLFLLLGENGSYQVVNRNTKVI